MLNALPHWFTTPFMPLKGVSDDLKSCIPVLYGKGYSVKDICHLLSIKKTLAYKVLNQYHHHGTISNPLTYLCLVRSPRSLHPADFPFISAVVNHCPSIYLNKLKPASVLHYLHFSWVDILQARIFEKANGHVLVP